MGLLFMGKPLAWGDAKAYIEYIREHGLSQFVNLWHRFRDRTGDSFSWGDEIEYMVVSFDPIAKNATLSLRQSEILSMLQKVYLDLCTNSPADPSTIPTFHPEYGRYMIETTPGSPYSGSIQDLLLVEKNMRYRRKLIRNELLPHEVPITVTSFPRLGAPGVFTDPRYDPADAQASHSLFLPDEITNPHVRFPTLTANIRRRRGSKVAINLPIFVDTDTPQPFIDPTIPFDRDIFPEDPEAKNGAAKPNHIYLDAMGFGMGCCCLQVTLQACNVDEARRVYDALVPIAPIMLALTAASPAYRGYLSDVDCRWNVIAGSVDDRTEEERGLKPLKNDKFVIPKSRYDSVDAYLSLDYNNRVEYNDNVVPYDDEIYERLLNHGIDDLLSRHIAHLFIRDPLVIFSDAIELDDNESSDHFENIQSTNWQTLRFKIPPPNSSVGWRVEFRSMEVQVTDFENAAFSIFIVLLSRAILSLDLNFYIPMSKVDENMQHAQKREAISNQKFYFRKSVFPSDMGSPFGSLDTTPIQPDIVAEHVYGDSGQANGDRKVDGVVECERRDSTCGSEISVTSSSDHVRNPPFSAAQSRPPSTATTEFGPVEDEYEKMTISEIFNGKVRRFILHEVVRHSVESYPEGGGLPWLVGLVNAYLDSLGIDSESERRIRAYIELVRKRADGTLINAATWIRNFIRSHPTYRYDSVVSQVINFDLMIALDEFPEFLPEDYVGSKLDDGCL
ncbi:glutamate-cysteine ligase catalytic subunit [Cantharellus anzutake]|uniref:glutamate-cysteine ligase catalytic subunit n=1 Tax=Cantharellus anzutake TaxID=1750568 RepID=UPI0019050E9B|nr:glutamate-cysteine ligase catalytic subunit [Cantharellus anzutake]KAF8326647.1 glutamate-cysteine ligase catalytic subunit [Cantharellus anzutake]